MLAKTLLVPIVALMAAMSPMSAQAQDEHVAYPMTLSITGASLLAPGEFGVDSGSAVTLNLFFHPQVSQYALLIAAREGLQLGPWALFAMGGVPSSYAVGFSGTIPPGLSGFSFELTLIGSPPTGQIFVLDPVLVHVSGPPALGG